MHGSAGAMPQLRLRPSSIRVCTLQHVQGRVLFLSSYLVFLLRCLQLMLQQNGLAGLHILADNMFLRYAQPRPVQFGPHPLHSLKRRSSVPAFGLHASAVCVRMRLPGRFSSCLSCVPARAFSPCCLGGWTRSVAWAGPKGLVGNAVLQWTALKKIRPQSQVFQ
ncbi:unnamed protein product [Effrenium voratum]|nr:unnamed protein product [Effrenium voratum]